MDALGIDPKLLLGQIVNFLILLVLLRLFLYGPMVKMLEERRSKVNKSMKDAKDIEDKLALTDKKTQEIMNNSHKEASRIISETQKIATQEKKEIIETAKLQSEKIIKSAQEEANKAKDNIISDAKREISDIIVLALDKIVGKGLDESQKQKLTTEAVKELEDK